TGPCSTTCRSSSRGSSPCSWAPLASVSCPVCGPPAASRSCPPTRIRRPPPSPPSPPRWGRGVCGCTMCRSPATPSTSPPCGTPGAAVADRIVLTGLECFGHHGVFPEEKREGQPFIVDITCWLEIGPAAATDDLTLTVNYAELAELAVSV